MTVSSTEIFKFQDKDVLNINQQIGFCYELGKGIQPNENAKTLKGLTDFYDWCMQNK